MNATRLAIGIGAGLISAVVFASATSGPLLARVVFFLLTPLPLFLAGLGWGAPAAAMAGIAGTLAVALSFNFSLAAAFAGSEAVPAVILCHLALLSRQTHDAATSAAGVEWYPVGRLVVWAAAIGGVLALLSIYVLGDDLETLRGNVRKMVEPLVKGALPQPQGGGAELAERDLERLTEVAMYALPAASAFSWMGGLLANLYLAGRITLAAGTLARPWPDIAAMSYPSGTPLAFAVATSATFLGGYPALSAAALAGALFLAYLLLGLAVVHYLTRGHAWRPFILWGVYAALILVNTFVPPLVAMLGLADTIAGLRRPRGPPGNPPRPVT